MNEEKEITPSGDDPSVTLETKTVNDVTEGNEPEVTSSPTPKQYSEALMWSVKSLATTSREIQSKLEGAKTSTKKNYYLKKLRKNNKLLADMIIRLEHYNKKGAMNETTS